jgi:hypothetical protein
LQVELFEEHHRCAPCKFNDRKQTEQRIRIRPDIGRPLNTLTPVLIHNLARVATPLCQRGLSEDQQNDKSEENDSCEAPFCSSVHEVHQETPPLIRFHPLVKTDRI